MHGLCCDKTYGAMKKYYNRDEDVDNYGNEDGNDDENAASGSGSVGPIFDPITMPRSCGVGSGDNGDGTVAAAHYVSTRSTIYLPYKYHIKNHQKDKNAYISLDPVAYYVYIADLNTRLRVG